MTHWTHWTKCEEKAALAEIQRLKAIEKAARRYIASCGPFPMTSGAQAVLELRANEAAREALMRVLAIPRANGRCTGGR